jgi:hypothetical protein
MADFNFNDVPELRVKDRFTKSVLEGQFKPALGYNWI